MGSVKKLGQADALRKARAMKAAALGLPVWDKSMANPLQFIGGICLDAVETATDVIVACRDSIAGAVT